MKTLIHQVAIRRAFPKIEIILPEEASELVKHCRGVVSNTFQQLVANNHVLFTDRFYPRKVRKHLKVNFKLFASLYLVWDVWGAHELVSDHLLFERNKNPPLSTVINVQLKMSLVHSAVWWFGW